MPDDSVGPVAAALARNIKGEWTGKVVLHTSGALDATVRRAYRAKGMRVWLWDIDTNDWLGKSRASLVRYVVRNSGKGDTVLMHMQWNGFSGTAIRQMKSGLANRGIK